MVNKFGTFQKTAKQADCDFYAAVYGKEESQKSLGSQIKIINRDCGNGSLGCQWIFSEPPMSIFFVFHVNTEQNVNLPHYGGMNKVRFMETDDGLLVNEINYTVEFRNSIKPTGVNIPGEIINYVMQIAES